MTAPIWVRLSSGRAVDLLNPQLAAIDVWSDLAMTLASLVRFGGHAEANMTVTKAPPPIYSVAQHCVIGADAMLEETGSPTHALAFLMHDAHEAIIGDVISPVVRALDVVQSIERVQLPGADAPTAVRVPQRASSVSLAMRALKSTLDRELFKLCGLPENLPSHIASAVKEMDVRMLDTEQRQILGPTLTEPYDAIWPPEVLAARAVRTRGELRPWTRSRAAAEWYRRFEAWRIQPAKAA